MRTITFNELRKIKDSLPSGSMHRIADELGLHVDTVRNFFGGHNFKEGKSVGIHLEPGPDGGLVMLDDTTVLDRALKILDELNMSMQKEQATESVQVKNIANRNPNCVKQLGFLICSPSKCINYGRQISNSSNSDIYQSSDSKKCT